MNSNAIPNEYVVTTPQGRTVMVELISDNIVKVCNIPVGSKIPRSASVIAESVPVAGNVSESGGKKMITTDCGITVTIDGLTGAVTIDAGDGRTLTDSGKRDAGQNSIALGLTGKCSFYGAGERGHSFNLYGDTLVMYNRQNYGYTGDEKRISQMNITMPLIISSNGYALLFDDYAAAEMITGQSGICYTTESNRPISYYFINGAGSLPEVMKNYTALTGRQKLPPLWALGYITSKYGYRTQSEATGVIDTLKRKGYPVDGMVLDLYWYGKESDMGRLEWDSIQWPDHKKMLADLKRQGVNTVIISQPYILRNGKAVDNYNELAEKGLLVKDSLGRPLEVKIWVGEGGMFDMSNPETRQWLRDRYKKLTDEGVTGWWGDLGEPEVHPESGVHANGESARLYHNHYGNDWSSIIYDLFEDEYPDRRLMTMMRGGTAGLQRYSVFPWSTDVSRSWAGLKPQITIMLNSGLSGLGYMSHDVGGFAVDSIRPTDPELYVRWLQLGTFSPILRTHAQYAAEPYNYPMYADIILPLIKERYRWLPYNYTLAYENASQGQPLVRPLNYHTRSSAKYDDITDQYLWGRDVMVAPVLEQGATDRRIIFPEGTWVDFNNPSDIYEEGDTIIYPAPLSVLPLFVRAGSFIPLAEYDMANTGDYDNSTYTIRYFNVENVKSEYKLYEDDMTLNNNIETDNYSIITFNGDDTPDRVSIRVAAEKTRADASRAKRLTFILERMRSKPKSVSVNGKVTESTYDARKHTLKIEVNWNADTPIDIEVSK
ncbi:MAG: hypothetical protein J6C78_08680 [Muribaculaceae bacterium]|nr:hypothetical protein [Muribaculaceae bacterium]